MRAVFLYRPRTPHAVGPQKFDFRAILAAAPAFETALPPVPSPRRIPSDARLKATRASLKGVPHRLQDCCSRPRPQRRSGPAHHRSSTIDRAA